MADGAPDATMHQLLHCNDMEANMMMMMMMVVGRIWACRGQLPPLLRRGGPYCCHQQKQINKKATADICSLQAVGEP